MAHDARNRCDQKQSQSLRVPPSITRMVPWLIIKQSRTKTVINISRADPSTFLLKNGSMVHDQTNMNRNGKFM